tara:strand:+ start:2366 stop:2746 length:381 start_codon:yes stop_codon:yes gene_type:complete
LNKEIIIFEKRAYMNFNLNYKGLCVTVTSKVEKLDASNASDLKSQLLHLSKTNHNQIILDLSDTKYCDSSGLSAILMANRLCKDTSGSFVLCGLQENVTKMIKIAQLDSVIKSVEKLSDAEALLNQ